MLLLFRSQLRTGPALGVVPLRKPSETTAPPRQKEVNPFFIDFEIIGDLALGTDYLSYESIRVVEFDLVPEIQHVSKEVNPPNQRFHQGKRK